MKTRTNRKTNTRTNGAVLQEEATEYRAISPTRHSSPATPADRLENFGIYRLARQLFDEFWSDSEVLGRDFRGKELARQQVRRLDSICAIIEEGYGRGFG